MRIKVLFVLVTITLPFLSGENGGRGFFAASTQIILEKG